MLLHLEDSTMCSRIIHRDVRMPKSIFFNSARKGELIGFAQKGTDPTLLQTISHAPETKEILSLADNDTDETNGRSVSPVGESCRRLTSLNNRWSRRR